MNPVLASGLGAVMLSSCRSLVVAPSGKDRASSREDHVGTVRISYKGRVVHVLFHEDFYRFRMNETPMGITEAFLTGKRPDGHSIIRVSPQR